MEKIRTREVPTVRIYGMINKSRKVRRT